MVIADKPEHGPGGPRAWPGLENRLDQTGRVDPSQRPEFKKITTQVRTSGALEFE